MNVNVKTDIIEQLQPMFDAIGPWQFKRALKDASKRAATSATKVARTEITKKWTIQKSLVGGKSITLATRGGAFAIYSRGKRPSSTAFTTNPKRGVDTTGINRQPVAVQCYKGKSPVGVANSWLWNKHGGLHLARRSEPGPRGGKYREITGPAVPQTLSSEEVRTPVIESMVDMFEKRLRHEYEYRSKGGKK